VYAGDRIVGSNPILSAISKEIQNYQVPECDF